ncbi:MAG: MATE family efflux transporter [Bacteroidales bacterium]|nr:MATE family efflux transporter [Bacteroidales bacterium]MEA4840539.1 MATE family efflux transporter [Bacteroidales bacterium]
MSGDIIQSVDVHLTETAKNNSEKNNASRLGTDSIGKLLLHYSLPAIIGMTASSLYNVIDRIFIGNGVGPLAISGLALTMPLMILTIAFGAMIGAGASTMVSIRLGQNRYKDATNILGNTLILNLMIGIAVTTIGLIFLDPILIAFGASPATLPYAKDFMQIILIANLFNHNFVGLNNVMRASGYPKKAMWSSLLTVLVNLCLAPIFIFVFHWGIRGAATATAIAQLCGFIWVMAHFINKSSYLHFQKGYFKLKKRIVGDILSIGLAPFLMNVGSSLIAMIVNISLAKYGGKHSDMAIGAYGIVNSVAMLFIMIVMGLNMGMQPIAGFNFGAHKNDRVRKVYKLTVVAATIVTTFGFAISMLFPTTIVSAFTNDAELIAQSKVALGFAMMMFPIIGFQMVSSNFFQSIGKASTAIFLSLSRQFIFLIPALLIIPHYFGLNGVWMALPTSDVLATFTTTLCVIRLIKKMRQEEGHLNTRHV